MIPGISQNGGSPLQELLRSAQKEQQALLKDAAPAVSQPAVAHAASSNLMAGNFASAERTSSRYTDAQLNSFKVSKEMSMSQKSTMVSVLDAFGGIAGPSLYDPQDNPKTGGPSENEIRKYLEQRDSKELMEKMQEEQRRKKAAERAAAEQALASGEFVEGEGAGAAPTGAVSAVPGNTATVTPMPEISGSNPAPAAMPEVASAPAVGAVQAPAPMPEAATSGDSAAPSAKTIDITI